MKRHKQAGRGIHPFGIGAKGHSQESTMNHEQGKGFLVTPMRIKTPEDAVAEYQHGELS